MSAGEIAVLVAAVLSCMAVAGLLVAVRSLRRETRRLAAVCNELRRQTVPLVVDAHRVVGQAASEMERVGAVLDSTESVHATVDTASKLAYRAFANPVVKVLAVRAGAASGLRRLRSGTDGTATGNGKAGRNGTAAGNGKAGRNGTAAGNGTASRNGTLRNDRY